MDNVTLTTDVVLKGALEKAMRPELLNRIDEIAVLFVTLAYERKSQRNCEEHHSTTHCQ